MRYTKLMSALVIALMIVSSIPLLATAQEANDTLIVALQADMVDMNPWNPDTNSVWKSNQIGWNFEGLMAYNPDFDLYPVLAAEDATGPNGAAVTIDTTDGLNMTMKLRQGVTFHDGVEMTSRDVVFSYQTLAWGLFQTQVLGPLYWGDGTLFEDWNGNADQSRIGVWATDDYTVKFQLTAPYAMFWYSTLALPIMPAHVWDDGGHLVALAAADFPSYTVDTPQMYGWDYSYGADATETDATIGTGPIYLESWVPEQGATLRAYEDYWDINGTTSWAGKEYPNYPQYVKTIKFKIYTQLDVAILALQNGEVHQLPWSLTPGYYNQLKTDPNIGIETPKDQGLFYLSFNQRKGAMADVEFRKAVAYAVDKDYIVNRLLGGYGIPGTVPMSVTNTLYVNTTVPAWIAGGDLEAAKATLDAAGYVDADGDGWRDMPDGSPLKYNILTPPKDYDPIRADSGIMIEKNLKAIGLNIAAVPTSFDTIVSAAFVSVDFDMYILGWTVGSFPEDYLRDFFHSSADTAINPAGSNAGGYNNAKYDALVNSLEKEMDTEKRVQMVKDACGLTMEDVAYDTLFYKTNIEAYRADIWTGWVPAFGSIYNGFSVFNLAPPTSGGTGGGGSSGSSATLSGIESSINMPSMAGAGQTVSGNIVAADILNNSGVLTSVPSDGATVEITTTLGDTISTTTGANGVAHFDIAVPYQKLSNFTVYANVSHSGAWVNVEKMVGVEFTNYIAQLSLSTDDGVIVPDASTDVTATVTDENGLPIEGVTVYVDTALMFGTVDAAEKATGADGTAVFNYTAPSVDMLPNTHRFEQFKANISVGNTIVPEIQSSSLIIGISSDLYDWHDLDITDVTSYVLCLDNTTGLENYTTITLELTDQDGTAIPDYYVSMDLSEDNTVIDADAMMNKTDANGVTKFNLTVDPAYTGEGTVIATFNTSKSYSLKDSVAIYIRNDPTYTKDMYHLNVTSVSNDEIMNTNSSTTNTTTVDVRLFNSTWAPVDGMDVYMALSDTSLVEASADSNTTNVWGNATFNITCIANGSADLGLGFGIMDGTGIFQGYNLKVNKTPATIPATQAIANELVFGPSVENSKYWYEMAGPSVDYKLKVWNSAYGWKPDLVENTNYTVTGTNITYDIPLSTGDSVYIWYNYTTPVLNENATFAANPGDVWLPLNNSGILDAQVYAFNTSTGMAPVLLSDPANYSLNATTGGLTLVYPVVAGDNIYVNYNYTTEVVNATVFAGPAVAGETGPWNLANTPIVDATIYTENGGTWTMLATPADYSLVLATGALTLANPLNNGDNIYAFYNYTYTLTQHHLTTAADKYIIDNNMFSNATPGTSHIIATLADTDGNPQAGVDIWAYTMMNDGTMTLDKTMNTTDLLGNVQFNVTSASNDAACVSVYFVVNNTAGVSDCVQIYNAPYVPGYAADIDFDGVAAHDSTMTITATVYDAAGDAASGVPCQFFIPPTAEGIPGVFSTGDEWGFYEYGDDYDMGAYAGYLGSWYKDNATVTDGSGQLVATIDTASFVADVAIPLEFGVGGTGTTHGFTVANNNWWWEDPYTWGYPASVPPMTDGADGEYYWMDAGFTMTDQVILERAPLATLTGVSMDQNFLSMGDNTTTVTLTFQDLAGAVDTIEVNFGEGTASPAILDKADTSATGVYTYDYTYETDSPDFDAGIGFTTVVTETSYAKFPFNFYLPYLATGTDAKTLVVNAEPDVYNLTIGDNITLNVVVTDEYGRLVSGAALAAGTVSATTDANGEASLVIPTAAVTDDGLYTVSLAASKGALSTQEESSVILAKAAAPAPETVEVIVGPVLDEDGNPIVGATVTITIDGVNYTATTNETGYAIIEVPDTALGQSADVTITADGYEDTTYTTTLGADGTLADNPPAVVEEPSGSNMGLIAILVIIVLVVVVLLVMMSKKGGKPPAAAPAEEPAPAVEETPEEVAPIEEAPVEEPVPEPEPVVEEAAPVPEEEIPPTE